MNHSCYDQTICIDKPSISQLTPSMKMSGLYKQTEEEKIYPERPLYRTEIGSITWRLLHRISSYYPENPNEYEKELAKAMFKGLGRHFPCKECALHYQQEIKTKPPEVLNNSTLSNWLCFQHNQVNKRLGKKIFNCNEKKLIEYYKL